MATRKSRRASSIDRPCAAAVAPAALSHRQRPLRTDGSRASPSEPTAIPPRAPVFDEGDLWGDLRSVGRAAGSPIALLDS